MIGRLKSDFGTVFYLSAVSLAVLALGLEAQATPGSCPADFDGDAQVGVLDLTQLLSSWGVTTAQTAFADFDGDGEVGCFDQEFLLGNWGPCPTQPLDVNRDGRIDDGDVTFLTSFIGLDCRPDLNRNGMIEENDVDALLCLWGTDSAWGDFDGSGVVDTADLTFLLASFTDGCSCDLDGNLLVLPPDLDIFHEGVGK
ncbi:MAG: hypothetical protein K0U98_23380 [Deltaproteobacteria bacterium]|nr:hypothetical protein [Deltaproteobacteria bacterium]